MFLLDAHIINQNIIGTMFQELHMALRITPDIQIFENPMAWLSSYRDDWLDHYEKTGELDWSKYKWLKNKRAPSGEGVDLYKARILLISSAGAYLSGKQEPFNLSSPFGDYSVRRFPIQTAFNNFSFSHQEYDHKFIREDPQVLLPLQHLQDMVLEGTLGGIAEDVVSFSGHQPNVFRVVKELLPTVLTIAQEQEANAAILVPSSPLCIQSCGLVARGLEVNRIATVVVSWNAAITINSAPPRAVTTNLASGCNLGSPGNYNQQRRIIESALALLEYNAPHDILILPESLDITSA
jgi:hypothetical protein